MASPYDNIPEDILKEAAAAGGRTQKQKSEAEKEISMVEEQKITGAEKKQKRIFKKRRAGVVLSADEVKAIKKGRKKLRKELKARGIKSKREFELIAGSLGLYFDKNRAFLLWLLRHWLWALLGALGLLLLGLFVFALVTQLRGHFTINMSDGMFKEGFTLSETVGFENPTIQLFANPAENVPCISIEQIPANIDEIDGEHNETYFAYTYYIRYEGESTVSYKWTLDMNSESLNLSEGCWVMLFEDGKMRFYAKKDAEGKIQALPPLDDNSRGYINLPVMSLAPESDQFQLIATRGQISYYRVLPDAFESDITITSGAQSGVEPMEVHKYTVVLWLEGDDPDTTDALINGHLGVEMNFKLESEMSDEDTRFGVKWKEFWKNLKFW